MVLLEKISLKEVSNILNRKFIGADNHVISGLNEIHNVGKGDLIYVDHPKYYKSALNSLADTIIIDKEVEVPVGKALIISDNPFEDYNKLAKLLFPESQPSESQKSSKIDPTAIIYPNVYVGENVTIGAHTTIYSGVCIMDHVGIGEHVKIGPNSVIGHSAFYYKQTKEKHIQMHSIGNVKINSFVEIGALCTIDKGVSASTVIGHGTKIDNQVHVGHDTVIGKNCLIASGVGISGCVTIEDEVKIWGQVGCASNVKIGKNAIVLGQSGVTKNIEGNKTYFGTPCKESFQKLKELAALQKLPEIIKNI
ncbi:UDP-3-O-(3-hydroxymyristoyl)glucosamine N-acyltransferase [Crocinitomicaceae bacterium]|nr:UDP-3-O-(3-hydroxymyristoyl)glucosamine N-acyltransferase [Crocinitomicaceae bacterium]MDC3308779.1 UDP-3-O-(3-hydroxymyristoyl)glucosamine N-acyltransferase [Crocinitomicaceae bacterium]